MATRIKNGRDRTILDVRRGGAGNAWQVLDIDAAMNGPSGGEAGVESIFGRTADGTGTQYLGSRRTGNPDRITGQIMLPLTVEQFLQDVELSGCAYDLRWRHHCGDIRTITNYTEVIAFLDARNTSRSYSVNLADAMEGTDEDIIQQFDFSAGTDARWVKLTHLDISKNVMDNAINKVISVGIAQCAGDCGSRQTGEEEFWAVTDRDISSGYVGNPTAMFGYTEDSGQNWTFDYVNVFQAADATDVIKKGDYAIIVSPDKGVAYALIDDIKNGVASPWTLATGIAANFPKALADGGGSVVWAAGDGGYIYKSTDGGKSFTTFDNALTTTENINDIEFASEDLGWFAADSGVLLKYSSGVLATVVVQTAATGGTTVTDNLLCVAVPQNRSKEVYVGTSAGEIWRSKTVTAQIPLFTELTFDRSGTGSIDDLVFIGSFGTMLYALQSNADGYSRVLRDLSGGNMGLDTEIIGTFTNPSNFGINSIAMANINFGLTVGEVHQTYAFIGALTKVSG